MGVRDKAAQYTRSPKIFGEYLAQYIRLVHYHIFYLNIKLEVSIIFSFQSVTNFPLLKKNQHFCFYEKNYKLSDLKICWHGGGKNSLFLKIYWKFTANIYKEINNILWVARLRDHWHAYNIYVYIYIYSQMLKVGHHCPKWATLQMLFISLYILTVNYQLFFYWIFIVAHSMSTSFQIIQLSIFFIKPKMLIFFKKWEIHYWLKTKRARHV